MKDDSVNPRNQDYLGRRPGIPIDMPLSYKTLPKLNVLPDRRFNEVVSLSRSLIKKAGLRPGTYKTLYDGPFGPVENVLIGLTDCLISELAGCDVVDLCRRLYSRHEEFLGYINKTKYVSAPDMLYGDSTQAAMDRLDLWQRLTPFTESIRWLIEIAVKHCESPGTSPGIAKVDRLIALANAIYMWDFSWEHIAHGVIPHELSIDQNFTMTLRPTDRAVKIQDAYRTALKPHLAENNKEWAYSIRRPQENITIRQLMELPSLRSLNCPLKEERGYSLTDWLQFTAGLIESFGPTKYCRLTKVTRLSRFLSKKWRIRPNRLENLLKDHTLSKQAMAGVEMRKLCPVEYARRDSRLLRRPVVVLGPSNKRLCIYGIETLDAYGRALLDRLISGRVGLPMKNTGPLKRAVGGIQTKLGDTFRDRIADRCSDKGFEHVKEKARLAREVIPQGTGFGPVDVFIVDRRFRRFVLVETKDVADEGTVPRLIKNELKEFLRAINKLESQINWFRDRVETLKTEFGISGDEDYAVEGVIVISSPRLWMYAQTEPLPVVDEKAFFRLLTTAHRFQTCPVPS